MLEPYPQNAGKLAIQTAVAVFFTIYGHSAPNPETSLQSDILCWLILLLLLVARRQRNARTELAGAYNDRKRSKAAPLTTLWSVAACIGFSLWYTAYYGSPTIYPLIVPLILTYTTLASQQYAISTAKNLTIAAIAFNNVFVFFIIGIFQVFVLSNWEVYTQWMALAVMAALSFVYIAFLNGNSQTINRILGAGFEEHGLGLSWRVLTVLVLGWGVQAILDGNVPDLKVLSLPYAWLRAIAWYCTALVAEQTSWLVAPAITTFSMLVGHDLLLESSLSMHLSQLSAVILALGYLQQLLFTSLKHKAILWCFAVGLTLTVVNSVMLSRAQSIITPQHSSITQHPIEVLIEHARIDHAARLGKQSHSYDAAHGEYLRRYNIEPPPGFLKWYDFATERQSPLIDDYDTIMSSVFPFLKLSGQEVVKVMEEARNIPDIELWDCAFRRASGELNCAHPTRSNDRHISSSLGRSLARLRGVLPDINFLVNHLDEPRVLHPKPTTEDQRGLRTSVRINDLAHQSIWELSTRNCTEKPLQDDTETSLVVDTTENLVSNSFSANDICQHAKYRNMHGMLSSPTSFKLIDGNVPVLSTGSLSTMGDILFPSPAYSEQQFEYDESQDTSWASKKNELFWTGSTTGGYASEKSAWNSFHRQRFISFTQAVKSWTNLRTLSRRSAVNGSFFDRVVSYIINKKLFNVAFTKIFQCDPQACADQKSTFALSPTSPASRIYKSRLTFDLDGNGISGRYYSLLASHSLPLKQTILREWHDDRLVPWVHYIPISLGMAELQDVVWYFTIDKRGKELAKEIAEEGREWFGKAMREVDRDVFVYRLMLELARLQDPERKAIV